jgi:hypothetical protein
MRNEWDEFVRSSKNGSFLFLRDYMEYHADRFPDASLVATDDEGRWMAILPATQKEGTLATHAGLTYGGFVTNSRMTTPAMLQVFEAASAHLLSNGIVHVEYKVVPHIYHRLPAEEDLYALFKVGATLSRRAVASVIESSFRGPIQERRRRGMNKARRAGVAVRPCSENLACYWPILERALEQRHSVKPVHTLEEIQLLATRFPNEIILHAAFLDNEMLAGVVVYLTDRVAHVQYIAASEQGRELGALDLLFHTLIHETYSSIRYFDFGISTEHGGQILNAGLIEQKEGFGARAVAYDHYTWSLHPTKDSLT